MGLRDDIIQMLQDERIPYEEDGDVVRVLPEDDDGFVVELAEGKEGRPVVHFEDWHEPNPVDDEYAVNLFGIGLSTACRLRVLSTGGKDHTWMMEYWDPVEREWVHESTTVLLFNASGPKRERILQNKWLLKEDLMQRKEQEEKASG